MKRIYVTLPLVALLSFAFNVSGNASDPKPVFREDFTNGPSTLSKWRSKHLAMWTVTSDGVLVGNNDSGGYGIGARSPQFRSKGLRARPCD